MPSQILSIQLTAAESGVVLGGWISGDYLAEFGPA